MKKKNKIEDVDGLEWITTWYAEQCKIENPINRKILICTIDNPGWSITIGVKGLWAQREKLETLLNASGCSREIVGVDWMNASVNDQVFKGYGGPKKLGFLIDTFKNLFN
jgi:hypothetical protein